MFTLQTVTVLSLTPGHIQDCIYEFCSFSIVTLCPVVASTGLAKDKVVGPACIINLRLYQVAPASNMVQLE